MYLHCLLPCYVEDLEGFLTLYPIDTPFNTFANTIKCAWLSPRFFKKASGILQSPPSLRHAISSETIRRNPTKVGVRVAHMNGVCKSTFFLAPGPGEGPKGQISLNISQFQLQSQLQRFLNQTLCVFSQMKDINISDVIFIWLPRTWGYRGGLGSQKNFFPKFKQIWCVSY